MNEPLLPDNNASPRTSAIPSGGIREFFLVVHLWFRLEWNGCLGHRLLTVTSLRKWLPSANIQPARVSARMLRPAGCLEKLLAMGLMLVG